MDMRNDASISGSCNPVYLQYFDLYSLRVMKSIHNLLCFI